MLEEESHVMGIKEISFWWVSNWNARFWSGVVVERSLKSWVFQGYDWLENSVLSMPRKLWTITSQSYRPSEFRLRYGRLKPLI